MKRGKQISIGENVRKIRIEKKLSQNDLSVLANMKQQTISKIETEPGNSPRTKTLLQLAKGLDVSLEELIKER